MGPWSHACVAVYLKPRVKEKYYQHSVFKSTLRLFKVELFIVKQHKKDSICEYECSLNPQVPVHNSNKPISMS